MPIIDVELVCVSQKAFNAVSAQSLAQAAARVFGTAPARTWVRKRFLPSKDYAENDCVLADDSLPVFVSVLLAHALSESEREIQIAALTEAIAKCVQRPTDHVHVEYAPPARGRLAFGGQLVK